MKVKTVDEVNSMMQRAKDQNDSLYTVLGPGEQDCFFDVEGNEVDRKKVEEVLKGEFGDARLEWWDASRNGKVSFHIYVPGKKMTLENMRKVAKKVPWADSCVYGKKRCFRLPWSTKAFEMQTKLKFFGAGEKTVKEVLNYSVFPYLKGECASEESESRAKKKNQNVFCTERGEFIKTNGNCLSGRKHDNHPNATFIQVKKTGSLFFFCFVASCGGGKRVKIDNKQLEKLLQS